MDLDKILHFIPAHIEHIMAVLVAMFSVTTILLLIRSLNEKSEDSNPGMDVRTLEGALKRVLSQNPPTVVEKHIMSDGDGSPANFADLAPLKNALADKEKQLAALNSELSEARAAAAGAQNGSRAAEVKGSATALAALESEIEDLKAKLTEYEIIEDDIADLALYKEENARLRREIEEARIAQPLSPQAAVDQILEANPAAGIPGLTEALEEEAAAKSASASASASVAAAPTPAPAQQKSQTPEGLLDNFGPVDTDKMLEEAEKLAAKPLEDEPEINALSDLLDTDKLLEEVNSLDAQDVMSEFKDKSKMG